MTCAFCNRAPPCRCDPVSTFTRECILLSARDPQVGTFAPLTVALWPNGLVTEQAGEGEPEQSVRYTADDFPEVLQCDDCGLFDANADRCSMSGQVACDTCDTKHRKADAWASGVPSSLWAKKGGA